MLESVLRGKELVISKYYVSKDFSPGIRMENGTMNGILEMVATKQTDVGFGQLILSENRMEVVDFLGEIWTSKITIYIKEPDMEVSGLRQILSPLKGNAWVMVIIAFVILSLMHTLCWIMTHRSKEVSSPNALHILLQSILEVIGIFSQQGSNLKSQLASFRIIYFSSCITATVVFILYSAIFVSFLTVGKISLPFTTFKEFLDDGTYKVKAKSNRADIDLFQQSSDDVMRKIYKKMIEPNLNETNSNLLKNFQDLCSNRKAGLLSVDKFALFYSKQLKCKIVGIRDSWIPTSSSLIINRKHHFRKLFTTLIQQLRGVGILRRMKSRMADAVWGDKNFQTRFTATNFDTVSIFFEILGGGIVLSLFVLFLELVYHKLYTKRHISTAK